MIQALHASGVKGIVFAGAGAGILPSPGAAALPKACQGWPCYLYRERGMVFPVFDLLNEGIHGHESANS